MPRLPVAIFGSDGLKPCTRCAKRLPANLFSVDKRNPNTGLQTWCKECVTIYRPTETVQLETKRCPKCGEDLPIESFGLDSGSKSGRRSRCKNCHSGNSKERHKKLFGTLSYDAVRYAGSLRRKYGITAEDYRRFLSAQNGVCAICKGGCAPRKHFDVDHVHDISKRIRGLLCRNCNNAVGLFHDDPAAVERAVLYLLSAPRIPECTDCLPTDPNLSAYKVASIKYRFGMTAAQYISLWREQNGVCAVCAKNCSTGQLLCVDHSHATNRIRGLLCRKCNLGLGKFKDSPDVLAGIRNYIDPDFSR